MSWGTKNEVWSSVKILACPRYLFPSGRWLHLLRSCAKSESFMLDAWTKLNGKRWTSSRLGLRTLIGPSPGCQCCLFWVLTLLLGVGSQPQGLHAPTSKPSLVQSCGLRAIWSTMEHPSTPLRPPPAPLEMLPLHILEYICHYLPRQSLSPLSLTSRFCYQAAAPRRFSRLKLAVHDKEKLRDDLQQWAAVLSRGNRFRHVRRVVLVGTMLTGDDADGASPYRLATDSDSDRSSDSDGDDIKLFSPNSSILTTQHKLGQHEAWLPFAEFLGQLPGLKDLVYACTHQVPACLLAALRQHHPQSRLHVRTFSLRSLYHERYRLHDIDPDELALATSPCLYSIRVTCLPYDSSGRFSFNLEAIRHMVQGHAPNLRRVSIYYDRAGNSLALQAAIRAARARWRGFPESSPCRTRLESDKQSPRRPALARLDALVISGYSSDLYHINTWKTLTDFSFLRRFTPPPGLKPEALEVLTVMAVEDKFRSLQALNLSVTTVPADSGSPTVDWKTSLFLQAVPPLQELRLGGGFGIQAFHTVLHRHGPTLRKLHLLPPSATPRINDLAYNIPAHFTRLETLRLRIQRQQGDPEEVGVYRALAKLPRLRRATLVLNCYVPFDAPVYYDVDAETKSQAEVDWRHETLANSAVDGALARAIFDEMTAAGAPLERLSIKTEPGAIGIHNFDVLVRWVARSWVCEVPGHGKEGPVVWEDLEAGWMGGSNLPFSWDALEWVGQECKELWADIWPSKGGNWKHEWSSFPLSARGLDD